MPDHRCTLRSSPFGRRDQAMLHVITEALNDRFKAHGVRQSRQSPDRLQRRGAEWQRDHAATTAASWRDHRPAS